MASLERVPPVEEGSQGETRGSSYFSHTILWTSRFTDSWNVTVRSTIDALAKDSGLEPLVLLPTDIMLEDYAPFYEVYYSYAADRKLESLATELRDRPRLVCLDIVLEPGFRLPKYLAFVNGVLQRRCTGGSQLAVFTESLNGMDPTLFDKHVRRENYSLSLGVGA